MKPNDQKDPLWRIVQGIAVYLERNGIKPPLAFKNKLSMKNLAASNFIESFVLVKLDELGDANLATDTISKLDSANRKKLQAVRDFLRLDAVKYKNELLKKYSSISSSSPTKLVESKFIVWKRNEINKRWPGVPTSDPLDKAYWSKLRDTEAKKHLARFLVTLKTRLQEFNKVDWSSVPSNLPEAWQPETVSAWADALKALRESLAMASVEDLAQLTIAPHLWTYAVNGYPCIILR